MNHTFRITFISLWCVIMISLCGCATHTPLAPPQNSLNLYNTLWDDFAGSIEVGKVYAYRNKGFNKKLHFHVLQVLSDDAVLIIRSRASDWIYGDLKDICEEAIFLVISKKSYADGAKLREGNYVCTGTYQYTTREALVKTVYVLKEYEQAISSTEPQNAKK